MTGPREEREAIQELENLIDSERTPELNPDEDLTWENSNFDAGVSDYD